MAITRLTNIPPDLRESIPVPVPELAPGDYFDLIGAIVKFTDWPLNEELPRSWVNSDGNLVHSLQGPFERLAARVEAGEVECYARRNDTTAKREPIYGLRHCLIGIRSSSEVGNPSAKAPDGTMLYDLVFRHRRRPCRRVMDEIKDEYARRYSAGDCSDRLTWDARDLLAWAKATFEPTEGGFPEETTVRVTLTNYRKELAGLA